MQHKKLFLLQNLPVIFVFYFANRFFEVYNLTVGGDFIDKTIAALIFLPNYIIQFPFHLSFKPLDLFYTVIVCVLVKLLLIYKKTTAKKYRSGKEYGSASWATEKDNKKFVDKDPYNNILLSATEKLSLNNRPKNFLYARNKNIMVIGSSGAQKTRGLVEPNIMQMFSSYVVTDTKGTTLSNCGKMLKYKGGYRIKCLNLVDFSKSMHYNPFVYIKKQTDILKLARAIVENTKGEGEKPDFWTKAEILLYCALIGYIWFEAPEEEKNFETLLLMLDSSEVREDDDEFENAIDMLFNDLEEENPKHYAVRQYKKYKLAAGKTAKSILISCGARLAPFDIDEVRELLSYDELELDTLGDRKTALFVIIDDTDDTFNFIAALMYTQLFNLLCNKAYNNGGRLKIPVYCILDEFANIGKIPKFEKLIAVLRSREIAAMIILQSLAQLKPIYGDHTETIVGNCDTTIFLGGGEPSTLKQMSELLGKETIDLYNHTVTKGQNPSATTNYQKTGKELMAQNELFEMPNNRCIIRMRGVKPFYSFKYDITKHVNYEFHAGSNSKNEFHIEKYLNVRLNVQTDDNFTVVSTTDYDENIPEYYDDDDIVDFVEDENITQ
ncbi:VirD4-like conjugal transfer protein, CD1115 family [Ruminococcus sp. Marseille-P6503]|uniref:VirD4-like conjugal transfer protein, CD1115 family n=1 Tax=Ruminococcus sp. Marseille-P6503 TaxID=2364796 RepID=UPI000F53263A|nr:type IV secretory system conjugative DNA transfer family protein [Ruminococcus sp. Marseille-P6503]